jgi:hypothetical protein
MRFIILPSVLILAFFTAPTYRSRQQKSSDIPDIDTTRGFSEICAAIDKKTELDTYSQEDVFNVGYCLGWMKGLTEGIKVAELKDRVDEKYRIFCPPVESSTAQNVHVVKKFIADHPEKEHVLTVVIAATALGDAFPCKESK